MKVILLNGSPRAAGCTFTGLNIIKEQLAENGVDSQIYQVGNKPVIGCTACMTCKQPGKGGQCAFNDDMVNTVAKALDDADGFIVGSAVHFASATGAVTSFLDRLFYCRFGMNKLKFGACIVSARRSGTTATFDQLNKYFTISQMPIVSSCYWNGIHGYTPQDVYADEEGVRTLKILADNMAYLIKCKHQSNVELPQEPPRVATNFIR
ncbi:MAG: flavodoxin family protein [Treponema sp.]|nr:flavodoxin family protein [Treponema sp.]